MPKTQQDYIKDLFIIYQGQRKIHGWKQANDSFNDLVTEFVKRYIQETHQDFSSKYKEIKSEFHKQLSILCAKEKEIQNTPEYLVHGIKVFLLKMYNRSVINRYELYNFLDSWYIGKDMFNKGEADKTIQMELFGLSIEYI